MQVHFNILSYTQSNEVQGNRCCTSRIHGASDVHRSVSHSSPVSGSSKHFFPRVTNWGDLSSLDIVPWSLHAEVRRFETDEDRWLIGSTSSRPFRML